MRVSFNFSYTPRRLLLIHDEIPISQPDSSIELFGPPVDVAFRDGVATKAGEGFAPRCGVDIGEISTIKGGDREDTLYQKRGDREEI